MAVRLLRALAGHQLPVDDRVRPPLPFEPRPPDSRVDGVRGFLLGVEDADVVELAVRISVNRLPPSRAFGPSFTQSLSLSLPASVKI